MDYEKKQPKYRRTTENPIHKCINKTREITWKMDRLKMNAVNITIDKNIKAKLLN